MQKEEDQMEENSEKSMVQISDQPPRIKNTSKNLDKDNQKNLQ